MQYPNGAQWWVIWLTVTVLWLFGIGMAEEENNPYLLVVLVVVTSLLLIWRLSKQKGA